MRAMAAVLLFALAGTALSAQRLETTLRLRDTSTAPDVILAVEATPERPFVQQQVLVRTELWQAIDLREPSLAAPVPHHALVEQLGGSTERTVLRDGRTYRVLTAHYALLPQRSGRWEIPPMALSAGLPTTDGVRPVSSATPALALEVRPAAERPENGHWLPAGWLEVSHDWPESLPVEVGKALRVTFTVRGGGITEAQLPELGWTAPEGLSIYPETGASVTERVDLALSAHRTWRLALLPAREGTFTLPAIDLPWWNSVEGRAEIARIPPLTLEAVASGAFGQDRSAVSPLWWALLGLPVTALVVWRHGRLRRRWVTLVNEVRLWHACRRDDAAAARRAVTALLTGDHRGSPELGDALRELDSSRFAVSPLRWKGDALWAAWRVFRRGLALESRSRLPDLYP